ncbi:head maturation protease, ClpP-related [Niabella sp. 22666]|uniref:head maturation protease, ClpP-related n=1 Tax=Niabella sp. 22666 TaxID=3453954 RepID=UPI003F857CD2
MKRKFWAVNTINTQTAEIILYGFIGEYENIDDAAFVADLRALEQIYSTINIRINCGGGSIYMGLAIFNAIRNSKAETHGFIDGIAASMGTIVAGACTKLHMSKYAKYMTHRAKGVSYGNAEDMRAYADQLDQLEDSLSEILAERSGLSKEEAKAKYITSVDRWIGADQALSEKLIDSIYDAEPVEVPVPENAAAVQSVYAAYNAVLNYSQNTNEMKEVFKLLGLPENATEAEVLAAINKLKSEKETALNSVKQAAQARAKGLVAKAKLEGKITDAEVADYEAQAEANFDFVEKNLAKIPVLKKPTEAINRQAINVAGEQAAESGNGTPEKWEYLVAKGPKAVAELKESDYTTYENLYEAHYGRKPIGL